MAPITEFKDEWRVLSDFFYCEVELDGVMYPTVEHAFVAAKTLLPEFREAIRTSGGPGDAKRMGRQLTLRADWEDVKVDVMRDLLRQKFSDGYPRICLLATFDRELIEGNNWNDRFWGVCDGEGKNMLGKLLMEIRAEERA